MSSIDIRKRNFLNALEILYGKPFSIGDAIYSRKQCIAAIAQSYALGGQTYSVLPAWLTQDPTRRADRGHYKIPEMVSVEIVLAPDMVQSDIEEKIENSHEDFVTSGSASDTITDMNSNTYNLTMPSPSDLNLIPSKNDTFVPWGHYEDISTILASKQFAPVYITGMSGNGKTTMIEQVCANSGRELVRVNITAETDEDDLLGGFRLINGETKFVFGGVIQAMQRGAILLLDEIDLGTERMMCLQPVLEGKGVFLKKIGLYVKPAPGFNVVATANTKGKGESDRFVGTRCLNEAYLDRFSYWFEQDYADKTIEARIIIRKMKAFGNEDKDFAQYLVKWAETIRMGFKAGGYDDILTTRRLEEICKAFAIFNNKEKAIKLTLTRFDAATQEAFYNLYTKIDPTMLPTPEGMKEEPNPSVEAAKREIDAIIRDIGTTIPVNNSNTVTPTTYAVHA
jgi:hypothetical protein